MYGLNKTSAPLSRLIRARALELLGLDPKTIGRRLRLNERTMAYLPLMEQAMPVSRCACCGGLVVMPCRKCSIDRGRSARGDAVRSVRRVK